MLKVDAQIDEYVVELFEDSKFKSVFILMNPRTSSNKVRILYCGEGELLAADGAHFVLYIAVYERLKNYKRFIFKNLTLKKLIYCRI